MGLRLRKPAQKNKAKLPQERHGGDDRTPMVVTYQNCSKLPSLRDRLREAREKRLKRELDRRVRVR